MLNLLKQNFLSLTLLSQELIQLRGYRQKLDQSDYAFTNIYTAFFELETVVALSALSKLVQKHNNACSYIDGLNLKTVGLNRTEVRAINGILKSTRDLLIAISLKQDPFERAVLADLAHGIASDALIEETYILLVQNLTPLFEQDLIRKGEEGSTATKLVQHLAKELADSPRFLGRIIRGDINLDTLYDFLRHTVDGENWPDQYAIDLSQMDLNNHEGVVYPTLGNGETASINLCHEASSLTVPLEKLSV